MSINAMSDFNTFVSIATEVTDSSVLVREADDVLERFTRAFNNCDIEGMDAEVRPVRAGVADRIFTPLIQ